MKVLFISNNSESSHLIKSLMNNNYSKINLIEVNATDNLMDYLTTDGPYSFVIIDVDNKNIDVSELYKLIDEVLGTRPFLFIGNQTSLKSKITDSILEKPLTNFIIETPLTPELLKNIVKDSIEWVKNEEFEESILEFARDDLQQMRLRNFYLFDQLPYDVYLELTLTKFGKIISKNKNYSHQLLQKYSKRNVKYLYIKKDEQLKFLDESIQDLLKIYNGKYSDKKKYVALHLKTVFFIHQFIKALSVSDDIIKLTNFFIESVHETVKSHNNIIEILNLLLVDTNMTFAEHSLATAYICDSILHYVGWTADISRDKLILSAILQDIGLNNEELIKIRSLNDPDYKMFTEADQIDYKNHPGKAGQISTLFKGFSDVDFILCEQHEQPNGEGFPKGVNSSGLTTISCIFILASNFVARISSAKKTPNIYIEILESMKRVYNTGNFKEPLKALEKSLKEK